MKKGLNNKIFNSLGIRLYLFFNEYTQKNLKEEFFMVKNQNGITLVALVITIVILIILATVSITFALNDGLFDRAQQSTELYSNSAAQEETILNGVDQKFTNLIDFYNLAVE